MVANLETVSLTYTASLSTWLCQIRSVYLTLDLTMFITWYPLQCFENIANKIFHEDVNSITRFPCPFAQTHEYREPMVLSRKETKL